jgi:hypothetical protein
MNRAWSDNFDSYETGQFLDGDEEDGGWFGWDDDPQFGAYVVDNPVFSEPHSVDIAGDSDLVQEFEGYTSGVWRFMAWQYVPSDFSGQSYFIILSDYAHDDPGANSKWAVQIRFDSAGIVESELDSVTLPLIKGQWVLLRTEIDLDIDLFKFYYNGDLLIEKAWTAGPTGSNDGFLVIDAVDLFANGASSVYYDDLSLDVPQPLSCDAYGPYGGNIGEDIEFDGSASGGVPPYSYLWEFGDGHTSEDKHPTHNYENAGNYTVILTVTDDEDNTASDTTWALINGPPNIPEIDGSTTGSPNILYTYKFTTTDPDNHDVYFIIDWDDGSPEETIGPVPSGTEDSAMHVWTSEGTYTIKAKARDIYEAESGWAELDVVITKSREVKKPFIQFLQDHLNLFPILKLLLQRLGL